MPRYRSNVIIGPWRPGEIFESNDPYYEALAKAGKVKVLSPEPATAPKADETPTVPVKQDPPKDEVSEDEDELDDDDED